MFFYNLSGKFVSKLLIAGALFALLRFSAFGLPYLWSFQKLEVDTLLCENSKLMVRYSLTDRDDNLLIRKIGANKQFARHLLGKLHDAPVCAIATIEDRTEFYSDPDSVGTRIKLTRTEVRISTVIKGDVMQTSYVFSDEVPDCTNTKPGHRIIGGYIPGRYAIGTRYLVFCANEQPEESDFAPPRRSIPVDNLKGYFLSDNNEISCEYFDYNEEENTLETYRGLAVSLDDLMSGGITGIQNTGAVTAGKTLSPYSSKVTIFDLQGKCIHAGAFSHIPAAQKNSAKISGMRIVKGENRHIRAHMLID